jgi:polygalacturonase
MTYRMIFTSYEDGHLLREPRRVLRVTKQENPRPPVLIKKPPSWQITRDPIAVTDNCPQQPNRRTFLGLTFAGLAGSAALTSLSACVSRKAAPSLSAPAAWRRAAEIRQQVRPPAFPDRTFDIRNYGAQADGKHDNSQAFAAAIKACHDAGGGKVLVTEGAYLTGPIHLLSNINLHIAEGARILFITDPKAYLPAVFTRWEGMELMGYSPLIYAYEQTNIAITGKGILDGQANRSTWWPWKGGAWKGGTDWSMPGFPTQDAARNKLMQDMERGVPVAERIYADGANLRPPFIQPYACKNVLIEGVTITNAPFWLINPVLCENVTIDGVSCVSHGPNSDGCDPESCKNVVIKNCLFDTGDDCIAIKSGRNADGRRLNIPTENVVISHCKMREGHGGVVIGSEISGGVRNVFVEHCEMSSPDLERGIRVKTNSVRGGVIENFYLRDITIGDVITAIVIDFDYEEGDSGQFTPTVRNIDIRDLHCANAKHVFQVRGYARSPIQNLHLTNCHFQQVDDVGLLEQLDNFSATNVTIKGVEFSV